MLINIGRQATECQQASEAVTLILKLQKFVDSEKVVMEEKINKISELSIQLYGKLEIYINTFLLIPC